MWPVDGDPRARDQSRLTFLLPVGLQAGKAATEHQDAYIYSTSVYACKSSSRETGDIYLENVYDRKPCITPHLLSDSSGGCPAHVIQSS